MKWFWLIGIFALVWCSERWLHDFNRFEIKNVQVRGVTFGGDEPAEFTTSEQLILLDKRTGEVWFYGSGLDLSKGEVRQSWQPMYDGPSPFESQLEKD